MFSQLFHRNNKSVDKSDDQYACTCYLPDLYTGINQNSMKHQLFVERKRNESETVSSADAAQFLVKV